MNAARSGSIRSPRSVVTAPLAALLAIALSVGVVATPAVQAAQEPQAVADAPTVERQVKVHAGLYELSTWGEDNSLWVAAAGSSLSPGAKLVRLDGMTLEEQEAIDMGEAAGFGVAVNDSTGVLYTTNTRAGNMTAVSLHTGEIQIIPNPSGEGTPHLYRAVVDEAGNMIYATVAQTPGQIWVIDGSTQQVDRIIENVGARPTGLIHDAANNRLYASNLGDNQIAVIDLGNDTIIDRIPTVGDRSTQLAHDPATGRLFVGNQGSNDISVIDLNEMRAVRRVAVGEQPVGVAFHPAENQIYVANRGSGTVSVIDGETYETIAELEVGTYPNTIHIDEETGLVYVTNKAARSPRGEEPTVDPEGDMVTVIRP